MTQKYIREGWIWLIFQKYIFAQWAMHLRKNTSTVGLDFNATHIGFGGSLRLRCLVKGRPCSYCGVVAAGLTGSTG